MSSLQRDRPSTRPTFSTIECLSTLISLDLQSELPLYVGYERLSQLSLLLEGEDGGLLVSVSRGKMFAATEKNYSSTPASPGLL